MSNPTNPTLAIFAKNYNTYTQTVENLASAHSKLKEENSRLKATVTRMGKSLKVAGDATTPENLDVIEKKVNDLVQKKERSFLTATKPREFYEKARKTVVTNDDEAFLKHCDDFIKRNDFLIAMLKSNPKARISKILLAWDQQTKVTTSTSPTK